MPALLQLALALLGAPTLPSACTVLSKAEAEAYLGTPISRVIPDEPAPDEDTGSIHTSCTFLAGSRALVIAIDEFPSAAAARKGMTADYMKSRDVGGEGAPKPTVEPEGDLGDQAFYGYSNHAAMMTMVKGVRAYAAVFGGAPPRSGDRAALRKLVTAMAGKV